MSKSVSVIVGAAALIFATVAPALAQESGSPSAKFVDLLPAALMLLLPIGFILLVSSAMPETQAPSTVINMLMVWGVATLAYFAVGFAFHFGGIAQVSPNPDFSGLYWEWYPLDQSVEAEVARWWGVAALQGWALSGAAATPGALQLFAGHIALAGLAALIPAGALLQRARVGLALLVGLLMGGLIYPLGGNWLWGGGWLAHLGASLGLGHGFVDFGGASVIFLAGSLVTLVGLVWLSPEVEEKQRPETEEVVIEVATNSLLTVYGDVETPSSEEILQPVAMPAAYLPILSVLGAGLMLVGWFGLASGLHLPTAVNVSPAQTAVNGLLSALSAALSTAAYSRFTTGEFNPLMTGRGLLAGLVMAMAGAPFIPAWVFVVAGLIMGVFLPLLIYLFRWRLAVVDELGTVATSGASALVGLSLVALFADGRAGQGWNGLGVVDYSGVSGQGVSGLFVAAGFVADWPGQLQAQLLGLGAVAVLAVAGSLLLFKTVNVVTRSWAGAGLEWAGRSASKKEASVATPSPEDQEDGQPYGQVNG